ncbi:MAG: hypothetical protein ACR2JP_11480 [Acidimicrobiia bacterium]
MTCMHEGCTCAAGEDGFCGEYCRMHGESHEDGGHRCECGHPECVATAVR